MRQDVLSRKQAPNPNVVHLRLLATRHFQFAVSGHLSRMADYAIKWIVSCRRSNGTTEELFALSQEYDRPARARRSIAARGVPLPRRAGRHRIPDHGDSG